MKRENLIEKRSHAAPAGGAVDQIDGERPVTFASAHLRLLKALDRSPE
jgi:hypothetical protein